LSTILLSLLSLTLFNVYFLYLGGLFSSTLHKSSTLNSGQLTTGYCLALVTVLLLMLNINQIVGARNLFAILLLSFPLILFISHQKLSTTTRAFIRRDAATLFAISVSLTACIALLFDIPNYWIVEGPNHDSIIYLEGLIWALDFPTQVAGKVVDDAWHLGQCGDGGSIFIGRDCTLYRGGTYTWLAWVNLFSLEGQPGAIWLGTILGSSFSWLAVRILCHRLGVFDGLSIFVISLFCTVSTGYLSALTNSNIATSLAAYVIGFSYVLLFIKGSLTKPLLIGASIALVGHFYAESILYAGVFGVGALFGDALAISGRVSRKLKGFVLTSITAFVTFLLCGNYTVYQGVKSLFFFTGNLNLDQEWASWYLHQPNWYWISSFVSGELLGHSTIISSKPLMIIGLVIVVVAFLTNFARFKLATYALAALSIALVYVVEASQYQYGEHKILQLMGPSWQIYITAAVMSLFVVKRKLILNHGQDTRENAADVKVWFVRKGIEILIIGSVYLHGNYIYRVNQLLTSIGDQHRLHYDDLVFTEHLGEPDVVLFDDTALVTGVEQFFKTHYAAFLINLTGARTVMPNLDDNILRGGYFRNVLNGSFERSNQPPNYVLQGKGMSIEESLFKYDQIPVVSSNTFALVDVSRSGSMAKGKGWYSCEPVICWTTSGFEILVYASTPVSVDVQLGYFKAPQDSQVQVHIDNVHQGDYSTNNQYINLKVNPGMHTLKFSAMGWKTYSPLDLEMSKDSRELFAQVITVSLRNSSK
jgi:hypothetical protein